MPSTPTSARRKRAAPRPYHHGDLRAALLAAAAGWLDEHGEQGLTLRELARAAGVSHAAPYHHFAGREELLAGVAERAFDRLADTLAVAAGAPEAAHALLDIGEAYVHEALAHPAQFRLMFGPLLARKAEHPGLQRAAERAFVVLLEAATRFAPERGLEIALAGWSLSHGAANLAIDGAFGGLPVAPAQARQLARLDAGALVRRMAAGLLQLPAPSKARRR
ncbi:MAG: TetR/AcrR family transcriptional regulator [Burkholderiales bacterium]|jgi:AcrR family transcriptional regulator|nr:TetR/AcrR family transcriptional regulator [Burkholderiales bacterium]